MRPGKIFALTWGRLTATHVPRFRESGLGWANFLVMRRTHATLMKALGVDGKLVADQLGQSLDVNQNVIRNRQSKAGSAW